MNTCTRIAAILVWALIASVARAQFVGDFFFATPSVPVVEGQSVALEIRAFVGADAFGAAMFDLQVDPNLAAIDRIELLGTLQSPDTLATGVVAGSKRIVVMNGRSLNSPIGTVSLARIVVRPLTAAGTTVGLAIGNPVLLRASSTNFATTRGFAAQISVVSAGSLLRAADPVGGDELSLFDWSAAGLPRLAPVGVEVLVHRSVLVRGAFVDVVRRVRIIDPQKTSEAGEKASSGESSPTGR